MFNDGVYHRVALKTRVDVSQLRRNRQRGGHQMVSSSDEIYIEGVFFGVNIPPEKGEFRIDHWDPSLEADGRQVAHGVGE